MKNWSPSGASKKTPIIAKTVYGFVSVKPGCQISRLKMKEMRLRILPIKNKRKATKGRVSSCHPLELDVISWWCGFMCSLVRLFSGCTIAWADMNGRKIAKTLIVELTVWFKKWFSMARYENCIEGQRFSQKSRNLWHLIVCYKKAKNLINGIETICRRCTFKLSQAIVLLCKKFWTKLHSQCVKLCNRCLNLFRTDSHGDTNIFCVIKQ